MSKSKLKLKNRPMSSITCQTRFPTNRLFDNTRIARHIPEPSSTKLKLREPSPRGSKFSPTRRTALHNHHHVVVGGGLRCCHPVHDRMRLQPLRHPSNGGSMCNALRRESHRHYGLMLPIIASRQLLQQLRIVLPRSGPKCRRPYRLLVYPRSSIPGCLLQ